jgi:hypothetical protein
MTTFLTRATARRFRAAAWCAALAFMAAPTQVAAFEAIPCAGATSETLKAAAAAGETTFRAVWQDASPNWYTAFDVAPPKRNPFDKTETPTAAPIRGVVWAHGLYCLANLAPDGSEVLLRYYARVISFHEGQTWSKPILDGLVLSYLARPTGANWQIKRLSVEQQILLPEAGLRAPKLAEVPAADPKQGIPCRPGAVWNGKVCAPVPNSAGKAK